MDAPAGLFGRHGRGRQPENLLRDRFQVEGYRNPQRELPRSRSSPCAGDKHLKRTFRGLRQIERRQEGGQYSPLRFGGGIQERGADFAGSLPWADTRLGDAAGWIPVRRGKGYGCSPQGNGRDGRHDGNDGLRREPIRVDANKRTHYSVRGGRRGQRLRRRQRGRSSRGRRRSGRLGSHKEFPYKGGRAVRSRLFGDLRRRKALGLQH